MKKKAITVLVSLCVVIVNVGFFPIVNWNPENPVTLNILMKFVILFMAVGTHGELGRIEAKLYPNCPLPWIAAYHVFLVSAGLLCRYLLEFGEVSNTYNFTGGNVLFQVAVLSSVSMGSYWYHIRKKPTDTES